ncbi:MAG: trehalose-phosphatase [Candidatus Bathyarchaeia archaeon]
MEHLFTARRIVEEAIRRSESVFLMLDYDGTITPIVATPQEAVLAEPMRDTLKRLAAVPKFHIAIISGRKLTELMRLVGLGNIYCAGNHGLEIRGPSLRFTFHEAAKTKGAIISLARGLARSLTHIPGVLVENKALTLSIHYRLAPAGSVREVRNIVEKAVARVQGLTLRRGKKVFEVKPTGNWHKGAAALWLLEKLDPHALPVYIGDDTTDEDAFRTLGRAVTILVAKKPRKSHAKYRLNDPEQVAEFLNRLLETNQGPSQRHR